MTTNTWENMKHLFRRDIDKDEISLINDYFYKCSFAEEYKKQIYKIANESILSKASSIQE
jgi:hypothetical protein